MDANVIAKAIPGRRGWAIIGIVLVLFLAAPVAAGETAKHVSGKYQVVAGNDDKAYLLDTSTGAVWVLTFRTLPTGREPVAIPFKFLRITPKIQGEFLMENVPGGGAPLEERSN